MKLAQLEKVMSRVIMVEAFLCLVISALLFLAQFYRASGVFSLASLGLFLAGLL